MTVEYDKDNPISVPIRYIDYEGYWKGIDNKKLMLQKCADCGAWCHLPQPLCPQCHSFEKESVPVSGKGIVYSWVTYHESPHPSFKAPYSVVLVELEEGPRIISNMVDVPPDEIEIGMKVEVVFDALSEELTLPKFKKWQNS